MGFILEASDGRSVSVNVWNWGVLHYLVEDAGLFPKEVWAPLRFNGGGGLEERQVRTLAGFLEDRVLPRLEPGERMFFNGTVTAVPDDGTFYREKDEAWRNYSLQRAVLVKTIDFLKTAGGPIKVY